MTDCRHMLLATVCEIKVVVKGILLENEARRILRLRKENLSLVYLETKHVKVF